ncbi:MAG: hypothetical protein ABIK98_00070 [Pseudomonadota bacterium]|uniref:Site-2 protease family protein n=1 Tax=Candidatus Desulfatibia profunda TaxID=2841695 RepID=A0A8J6NWZ0_9BACT|nr:hypothetical protein [Candidatus Desulfatibia profunda]MBL7180304.1 hypothetical protein [Desulfobacterales bacterium]
MPLMIFNSEEILYYSVTILAIVAFSSGFTRFFALSFANVKPAGEEAGFDFNPFGNLDIVGTIVFFLGGFGWGRQLDDQKIGFKQQKLGWLIISLIAPFASLTLALSAAYMKQYFWTDRVVEVVLHLCAAVTAYHILPIPPLAGSRLIYLALPGQNQRVWRMYSRIGPYIILALVIAERFSGVPFLTETVAPVMDVVTRFVEYQ